MGVVEGFLLEYLCLSWFEMVVVVRVARVVMSSRIFR